MNRTAIIGSGITGLSIARTLGKIKGINSITIFDKSRRPGGRISTRTSRNNTNFIFDHGLHFIDPKNSHNQNLLKLLENLQCTKTITIKSKKLYTDNNYTQTNVVVGSKYIESIPISLFQQSKALGEFNTRISSINRNLDKQYYLESQSNQKYGPYDRVYVCLPYPQCRIIKQTPSIVQLNQQSTYNPIWTIMLSIKGNWKLNPKQQSKKIHFYQKISKNIEKAFNQNIKYNLQNKQQDLWVFNMSATWSIQNINKDINEVEQAFLQELSNTVEENIQPTFIKAHRWLYGKPLKTIKFPIINNDKTLIFAGDWIGENLSVGDGYNLGEQLAKL